MLPAVRSELRKFFTTRLWWGMALGIAVVGALPAGLVAANTTAEEPTATNLVGIYTVALSLGTLLTLVVGVIVIGSEYRHRTATATFLATPRRPVLVAAKCVALLVIGTLYGLVFLAAGVGAGAAAFTARGLTAVTDVPQMARSLVLCLLVLALWALIGLGVGVLLRNQIAAMLVAIVSAWIVEPLITMFLAMGPWDWTHPIAKFLPTMASRAVTGESGQESPMQLLTWWQGSLTLLCYALVMAGLGIFLTMRRDIV